MSKDIPDWAALVKDARPTSEADWGSDRQVDAENRLWDALEAELPRKVWNELEDYCLKATTDEQLDEAARIIEHMQVLRQRHEGQSA